MTSKKLFLCQSADPWNIAGYYNYRIYEAEKKAYQKKKFTHRMRVNLKITLSMEWHYKNKRHGVFIIFYEKM